MSLLSLLFINLSFTSLSSSVDVPPPTGFFTLSLHDALPILGAAPEARVQSAHGAAAAGRRRAAAGPEDRKSTRLNSSHVANSYAVFCLKKKNIIKFQKNIHHIRTRILMDCINAYT